MANEKIEEKKTNWPQWIQERIGSGSEAPQKANLKFGRIAWCQAFDRGDQYKILNETTGVVEDVYMTRETKCIYNICKAFNDAYTAKMLKGDPIPTASPYSTNTEEFDEDLSVATNGAIEYWWKNQSCSLKLYKAIRTAAVGGIGVVKIVYDKNKKSGIYDGETIWESVNPLHFYPNVDATCDEEFREIIHRFPKNKDLAQEEFAEQMKKLGITELEPQSRNDAHPEIADASKKIDAFQSAEQKDTIIESDIWIKKCKKYPNGKHVIVIGDHTLVEEDNPEPDKLPFFTYVVNPLDNDMYGLGVTYPIIPIQRDMNKNRSIITENAETMGHLKWLVKEGSVANPSAFDDMSGEVVEYTGEVAPHQSTANPIPVHINGAFWDLLSIAKFITKLQDIGTWSSIPRGGSQMANGTTQEIKNSEDVLFAPDIARAVEFVQKIVRRYLFLAKKYYKEERIITIIGENKRPEAISFFAEKLKDDYNVDIKVGGGFARSDDAQVQAITNLMQTPAYAAAGIDPRLVMEEMFKKMGLTKLKEDTFKDERQAKRYLDHILSGQNAPISKYVNPNAHIKVFTDFIKQPQYDVLPLETRVGIDRYLDQMVAMTIGQGAPVPTLPPGNMAPVENAPPTMNAGGMPPAQDIGQAAEAAPSIGV